MTEPTQNDNVDAPETSDPAVNAQPDQTAVANENPPAEGDSPSAEDSTNSSHEEDDDPESNVGDPVE